MRRREWIAAAFGLGAAATAVLAVGGALRGIQAAVALLVAGGLVPLVGSRRTRERPSPLVALLAVPLGLTALQLVPLPAGVIEALAPTGAGLREDGAALAGTAPWRAISLDAPGSLRALCFFVILLGVAALSLRLSLTERGRYRVLAGIAALCGAAALVTAAHELAGATALYGVYEPVAASPAVLGPLLNGNHLGGLLAAGAVLGLALVMYRNQRGALRATWAVVTAGCAAGSLATLSRGAALALAAGGLVTVGALIGQRLRSDGRRRRRRDQLITSSLPIGVVGVCALVIVVYTSAGGVGKQLGDTSLAELQEDDSKFGVWRSAMRLVEESPWLGVGRGAFEPAFTRVHPPSALQTASHVENEYVQAVVDWGIVGAVLCALAAGWLAISVIRRWHDGALAAGALGALAVLAVQSVVDFGVELLGVAVPAVAIAGTLAYRPVREAAGRALLGARLLRLAHIAALAAAAALLLADATTSVAEDHEALAAQRGSDRAPVPLAALAGPLERHPLDYFLYGLAAEAMIQDGDPRAIRTLNHALVLHPTHAGLHRMAARLLYRGGHDAQATLEYAAAMRGVRSPEPLIAEALRAFKDPATAARAIPMDAQPLDVIVRALVSLERVDVATTWLAELLRQRPKDAHACELLYSLSLRGGDLAAAEVTGRHCVEIAPSRQTRLALARVLFQKGAYAETIRQLHDVSRWTGRIDEIGAAWLLVCDAHRALKGWDEAVRCLHRLDASGFLERRRGDVTGRLDRIEADRAAAATEAAGSGSSSGSGGGAGSAGSTAGSAVSGTTRPP
ncbi:MAG TPA: O-antigen ligase family protein [Kofleriaceae bacterium]|nr:O-antigen ligase family protein [Kofleriaceae bacterium]